jgi:hypothetical protein
MAYAVDGTDLVISGWEQGISDNPYQGINDMRGVNIISVPGEASVSFASTLVSYSPLALSIVSASGTTLTVTVTSGSLPTTFGQCITFSGASLPSGITAGTLYWIAPVSYNTIKLYSDFLGTTVITFGGTGTGTGTSVDMAAITYFDKNFPYGVDSNGRVWEFVDRGLRCSGRYMGNTVNPSPNSGDITGGNGICVFSSSPDNFNVVHQYLFVFGYGRIDYFNLISGGWTYEWNPATGGTSVGIPVLNSRYTNNPHEALVAVDGSMYYTDGNYLGSLSELYGQVFNPAVLTTYTWVKQILKIPNYDTTTCLEELGTNLLIGGTRNQIYPWDKTSVSFQFPIKISDNYINQILTINTNAYIFAGMRGRIFVTNGAQATLYAKIPDHLSGGIDPIFTWQNIAYNKNQIYFGISATDNAGNALTSYRGLWAVDITTNAIRVPNLMSDNNATVTAIYAFSGAQSGFGLLSAWQDGTSFGVDTSGSTPYTSYVSYIETDIIPVGQFLNKKSFNNLEFKLAAPLVSGESIKISYRTSRTGSYSLIGETTTAGLFSDIYTPLPFEQVQWLQFKIEMKSTATNPSYVRLVEIRLR